MRFGVEIDTLWNVKRINIFVIRYPASVEIDTVWNVKSADMQAIITAAL